MKKIPYLLFFGIAIACTEPEIIEPIETVEEIETDTTSSEVDTSQVKETNIWESFGDLDLENLYNYANQDIPDYITKDNTMDNPVSDKGATLGRVLFYDKNLSIDGTVSCSSCHQQAFAFSDPDVASEGVNGTTGRHSMRLINSRFAVEAKFFWDERAETLEIQTTMPIQDHTEMGFSGEEGNPTLDGLIIKMEGIDYYPALFAFADGDSSITEERIQKSLAQFVRSIQSFDSKFDEGRAQVDADTAPFPNYSDQENQGKQLFMAAPVFDNQGVRTGGVGCAGCHAAPEFDIDPNTLNNGHVSSFTGAQDFTVTRAPSLRDLINPAGEFNGPLMHDGALADLDAVLDHYNEIDPAGIENLDRRLTLPPGPGMPPGGVFSLDITNEEREALKAFLRTLTGSDVYTNPKWSNPFQ